MRVIIGSQPLDWYATQLLDDALAFGFHTLGQVGSIFYSVTCLLFVKEFVEHYLGWTVVEAQEKKKKESTRCNRNGKPSKENIKCCLKR